MFHVQCTANSTDLIAVSHWICRISQGGQLSFGEKTALTEVADMKYNSVYMYFWQVKNHSCLQGVFFILVDILLCYNFRILYWCIFPLVFFCFPYFRKQPGFIPVKKLFCFLFLLESFWFLCFFERYYNRSESSLGTIFSQKIMSPRFFKCSSAEYLFKHDRKQRKCWLLGKILLSSCSSEKVLLGVFS